jgi:hypothetical protein
MKTRILKFFALAVVVFTVSASAFGQAGATATSSATIVTPISITQQADMNFGNLAVSGSTAGTVSLPAAAAPVRSATAGVTLPATTGTVQAARFNVTGESGYTYAITLPANGTVTLTGPGPAMACNDFVSSPTVAAGGVLTGGAELLYVGATLSVAAGQTAGLYTSAAFTVTVNYN